MARFGSLRVPFGSSSSSFRFGQFLWRVLLSVRTVLTERQFLKKVLAVPVLLSIPGKAVEPFGAGCSGSVCFLGHLLNGLSDLVTSSLPVGSHTTDHRPGQRNYPQTLRWGWICQDTLDHNKRRQSAISVHHLHWTFSTSSLFLKHSPVYFLLPSRTVSFHKETPRKSGESCANSSRWTPLVQ